MKKASHKNQVRAGLLKVMLLLVLPLWASCNTITIKGADNPPDAGDTDSESDTGPLIDWEIPGWEMSWFVNFGGGYDCCEFYRDDRGLGVAALEDGSSFVTGTFAHGTVLAEGEPNETSMNPAGICDGFVAKYAPDGRLEWARKMGALFCASRYQVVALSDGGGLVSGKLDSQSVFFPGAEGAMMPSSPSGTTPHFFVARFSGDGDLLWAMSGGDPDGGGSAVYGLSAAEDWAYIAGYFSDKLQVNAGTSAEMTVTEYGTIGNQDGFVAAISLEDGHVDWIRTLGGEYPDYAASIARLADDSAIVLGKFQGVGVFGEGDENETLLDCTSEGLLGMLPSNDICLFLAKYGSDGGLIWARKIDVAEGKIESEPVVAARDELQSFAIALSFEGTLVLPGADGGQTTLTSSYPDSDDIALARYSLDGELDWVRHIRREEASSSSENYSATAVAYGISLTPSGRIALCGGHNATLVFGEGDNQTRMLQPTWSAGKNPFLSLFDSAGEVEWVTSLGGPYANEYAYDVATAVEGTIFLTGNFGDEAVFGTNADDAVQLEASPCTDTFVMKIVEDGHDAPR